MDRYQISTFTFNRAYLLEGLKNDSLHPFGSFNITEIKNNVDEYEVRLKLDLDSGYELDVKIKSLLRTNLLTKLKMFIKVSGMP